MGERRRQLLELAGPLRRSPVRRRHPSVEPVAGAADHRHAALPPQRRGAALRRLAQQQLRPARPRRASAAPTGRSASRTACARYLPHLLAFSASSPFVEGRLHAPPLGADADLHAHVPALRRCPTRSASWDAYERYVRFLYDTGSITEHTQLWWSVRPHLAFPTVEIRICDGQPELGEVEALSALMYALAARIARAVDEGEPLPEHPHRLIEENLWRAIRYGLSGELIDLDTRRGTARARRARAADRVGAARWPRSWARASFLAVPGGERRRAADGPLRGGGEPRGDLRAGGPGARPV